MFVNSSLVCGGAERVITELTKYWASAGTRTTVVTIHSPDHDHFELDPRVGRVSLDEKKEAGNVAEGLLNNARRVRKLRRVLRTLRPTVVISFQDRNNVLSLIASAGLGVPVIVCERNDPRMKKISRIWGGLRRISYRRASALAIQTQSLAEWGQSVVGANRVHVVPNPVSLPTSAATAPCKQRRETLLTVGRLVRQKGFDMLLEAVGQCKRRWALELVGDGPDLPYLRSLAEELDVGALARAIDVLMSDPERRLRMGHRAQEVVQRFATGRIVARWNAVIDSVCSPRSTKRR